MGSTSEALGGDAGGKKSKTPTCADDKAARDARTLDFGKPTKGTIPATLTASPPGLGITSLVVHFLKGKEIAACTYLPQPLSDPTGISPAEKLTLDWSACDHGFQAGDEITARSVRFDPAFLGPLCTMPASQNADGGIDGGLDGGADAGQDAEADGGDDEGDETSDGGSDPPADPIAWAVMQHNDNFRTGWNASETLLTVDVVAGRDLFFTFGEQFCWSVDGKAFAQPLAAGMVAFYTIIDVGQVFGHSAVIRQFRGVRNLLYVATQNDSVYVFDIDTDPSLGKPDTGTCDPAQPSASKFHNCAATVPFYLGATHLSDPAEEGAGYVAGEQKGPTSKMGILGTPAIDFVSGRMFLVARTEDVPGTCGYGPGQGDAHCLSYLHAIDITTGLSVQKRVIDGTVTGTIGPPSNPHTHTIHYQDMAFSQRQRPGLLVMANGFLQKGRSVYVAFGEGGGPGFGGICHESHGWIFAYDADTLVQKSVFVTSTRWYGGGMWQGGNGIASDEFGNHVYATSISSKLPDPLAEAAGIAEPSVDCAGVGLNAKSDQPCSTPAECQSALRYGSGALSGGVAHPLDDEESLIGLSAPSLTSPQRFSPGDFVRRIADDVDFGSTGPLVVPFTNWIVAAGKPGDLHVLDRSLNEVHWYATSPFNPTDDTESHPIYGSPVYWIDSKGNRRIYVWPRSNVLTGFTLDGAGALSIANSATDEGACPSSICGCPGSSCIAVFGGVVDNDKGGILSISSNGSSAGTGIVWVNIPEDAEERDHPSAGHLYAFDAENLRDTGVGSASALFDHSFGPASWGKFVPPTVANGRVFVSGFDGYDVCPGPSETGGSGGRVRVYGTACRLQPCGPIPPVPIH